MNRAITTALAALTAIVLITDARAATTWTNFAGGDFGNGANWSAGAPTSGDEAQFTDGNTYTVGFSASQQSQGVAVSNSTNVTLDLGAANTYTPGFGTSTIAGTLHVTNGGVVDAKYNSGADSIDLNAGGIEVLSGATLRYGMASNFAGIYAPGSGTTILVDGSGSLLDGSTASVDRIGPTAVTISNGGEWKAPWLYGSGVNILVTGANSKFTNSTTSNGADLSSATGFLTIQDGGAWSSGPVNFGYGAAPVPLTVGGVGAAATMQATQLNLFASSGWADVDAVVKSNGKITVTNTSGSSLRVPGGYANVSSVLSLEGGTVDMAAGGTLSVEGNIYGGGFTSGGTLRGSGTIERLGGSGSFTINNSAGAIRPGDTSATPAIGTLTVVNGDLTQQTGGVLYLNLTSGNSGDLIALTSGTATLAGTIDLSILGGYTPQRNDVWDFVRANTVTDTATDNVASMLAAAGYNGFYTFGVVNRDGQQVLELALPEPASAALLGAGIALIAMRRRHKA